MIDLDRVWLEKAEENLAAAQSDLAEGRYDSCASRSYYGCFHAAVYALIAAGIRPRGTRGHWGHDFVQAEFNGRLIGQRKTYPAQLRGTLNDNYALRETADYTTDHVPERRVRQAVARTLELVNTIRAAGSPVR